MTPLAGDYAVVAGVLGAAARAREPVVAPAVPPRGRRWTASTVEVRMESWLASDTIRRMGFGHVVAARHHTLIVERGVSFVAFDAAGRAARSGYASDIFAPQPRLPHQLAQ